MKESELKKLYLTIEGRTYRPIYEYTAYEYDKNEDEYVYKNLVIIKTAQEVYDECLENKNKIDNCPPKTLGERVEELEQESKLFKQENELLKQENQFLHTQVEVTTQNQEFLESCLMEIAEVVYA